MVKSKAVHYSRLFLIALILLALAGGGYFYLKNKPEILNATSIDVRVNTLNEETKLYKISAEYPYFASMPADFNSKLKDLIASKAAEFKKAASDNWQMRRNDPATPVYPDQPWPFTATWTAAQLNNRYISFVLRFDSFVGGANQIQEIYTFNYDLVNRRDVKLADLFIGRANYLQVISDYTINALLSRFKIICGNNNVCIPTDMINSGASAKEENYSRFAFDNNVLVIYFPKSQVAPAAAGEQDVFMPRNLKYVTSIKIAQ